MAGPPAPVPTIYNWTGFYVGLNGGLGGGPISPFYDLNGLKEPGFPGSTITNAQHHRMGGGFAGGQAGYNHQFGNVVLGLESDLQWSNVGALRRDDSIILLGISRPVPIGDTETAQMSIRQNWFGTTRLRAGYAFAERSLAYLTGGIAYSNFFIENSGEKTEVFPTPGTFASIGGANSATRIGWTAGAGLELGLSGRISLKSEYLYTAYSGFDSPYVATDGSDPHHSTGTFSSGPLGIHLVRAGLNYRLQDGDTMPVSTGAAVSAWSPNWTGFYAGFNGGYGAGVLAPHTSETYLDTVNLFPGTLIDIGSTDIDSRLRSGGFQAGIQFGYNRELPNRFVAGFETDFQWSGIRGASASLLLGSVLYKPAYPYNLNASLSVNQNWFGTTRLRLGYRASERLLAYATGGLAYSSFSAGLSSSFYDSIDGPALGSKSGWGGTTRLGWAAGAGAEYALWNNVSFKTEYLYTQYDGFGVAHRGSNTDNFFYFETTQGVLSTGTIGIHLLRAGLNWKLGG